MVELSNRIVTGFAPSPLGFRTALNQMYLPAAIAVPLKFEVIETGAGVQAGSVVVVVVLLVLVVVVVVGRVVVVEVEVVVVGA